MFQFSVKSQSRHFSILPKENVYLATPVYFFQNSAVWKRVFDAALEFCLEACFHSNKSSAVSESFFTFYLRSRYTICVPEKCFVIAIFWEAGIFHQAVVTLQTTSCCAFLPDSMQSSIREYITHCLKITGKSRISFLVHCAHTAK